MENFRNDGNVDPVIEHLEAELDEHQAAGNFEAVAKVNGAQTAIRSFLTC